MTIKDYVISILVILLLVMTFMGSPIKTNKSEIDKLHYENDSLKKSIVEKDKRFFTLEKDMIELKNKEVILNDKLDKIDKLIISKKRNIRRLESDEVLVFYQNHFK